MFYDYWPSAYAPAGERGSIFLQVGFADGIDHPWAYTMNYDFCVNKGFMPIVNYCDNSAFDNKRGGFSVYNNDHHGNDRLFWTIDPNPIVKSPYRDFDLQCNNTAYYWQPWPQNVAQLGYTLDPCRTRWDEQSSPREGFLGPNPPWDCLGHLTGTQETMWRELGSRLRGWTIWDGLVGYPDGVLPESLGLKGDGWADDNSWMGGGWHFKCRGVFGVDRVDAAVWDCWL